MNKTIRQKRLELLDLVREELNEKQAELEKLNDDLVDVHAVIDELIRLSDTLIED